MSNNRGFDMNELLRRFLDRGGIIDITTTGRRTGKPRRVEITFHNVDGRIVISGMPVQTRKRAWLRNLEADPRMTFHVKWPVGADLPATARIVTDEDERRALLTPIARAWRRTDLESMVAYSPLVEVSIPGYGRAGQGPAGEEASPAVALSR